MIQVAEKIWIGNSATRWRDYRNLRIKGVLNVAQDLRGIVGWPDVEYMQVGLIDGPGNLISTYCAAVLSLAALVRHHRTLVFCHTGSRSMAVAAMYLNESAGRNWDDLMMLLGERVDEELPKPHPAHHEAFDRMNWSLLRTLMAKQPGE